MATDWAWRRSLAGLVVAAALVSACGVTRLPASSCRGGDGLLAAPIVGGGLSDHAVVLTFDGGPGAVTSEIGDLLFANDIAATFFVDGKLAADAVETLAKLKSRGHLIGQRGYSGARLTEVPSPALEVRLADGIVAPYVSGDMFLLRAPDGAFDARIAAALNGAGLHKYVGPIGWDVGDSVGAFVDDADCLGGGSDAEACAQGYADHIQAVGSGIVRFRSMSTELVGMLRALVPRLKQDGFSFLRLDAVAAVSAALERAGGRPGTIGGPAGCDEY